MSKVTRSLGVDADSFVKKFRLLAERRAMWEAWSDFITLGACAISNAVDKEHFKLREKQYLDTIQKYKKSEQELFPELLAMVVAALEHNPDQDFLGELYMALELGNHWKGQFFTPYSVTRAMAAITYGTAECLVDQIETQGVIAVNDCACGAGATLIAAANTAQFLLKDTNYNWQHHFLFTAQDIDPVVAKMCYIQLSLLGCAGFVKIGDTFTDPMRSGDDKTNYWYTPLYYHHVWSMRRKCRIMDKFLQQCTPKLREDKPAPVLPPASQPLYYYFYEEEDHEIHAAVQVRGEV